MQVAIEVVCLGVGILGVAFGLKCYSELRKWARQCQYARIAISYKGKVKLHAPLTEWIAWVNMLDKDKDSHGRVVYRMNGTAVAITKRQIPPRKKPFRKPSPVANHGARKVVEAYE